ncbi:Elongator subunit elp2 [Balamuthia mandrillaris]
MEEQQEAQQQLRATVHVEMVNVGCNRVAHAACWGYNGLVAYGASNMVALYAPESYKIIATLRGHHSRVNVVQWIPVAGSASSSKATQAVGCYQPERELVSGASDNAIHVWRAVDTTLQTWELKATLKGHKEAVNALAVLTWPTTGETWLASTSSDHSLKIWKRPAGEEQWVEAQSIAFPAKMMECVAMTTVPGMPNVALLAVGGVDSLIHLYVSKGKEFVKVLSLDGHEDWLRSVAFACSDEGDILLASSSQDNYIRLWKIHRSNIVPTTAGANSGGLDAGQQRGTAFRLSQHDVFAVVLESVLFGHEDWVYSVCWHPPVIREGMAHQPLALLSASMDRTMMIWRPDSASGLWLNEVRVGELGGNTLGFYGGLWSPRGSLILAHGYNGAFHLWKAHQQSEEERWEPEVTVSGHFLEVEDLMWDPSNQYLVSVGKDQTTRLFAPWNRSGDDGVSRLPTWHEIARPQVHGYDMSCLSFLHGTKHRFASGADEKVIRVFDAPQTFVLSLQAITGISNSSDLEDQRPLGANVPPLGLSNKPTFGGQEQSEGQQQIDETLLSEAPAEPALLTAPPFEEHLLQSTLWPEIQKLYGHGNDLICLASSYSGAHLVSACKGSSAEQCSIIVWDTKTWRAKHKLAAHKLTVTQLQFSHNDQYLLSVSRDRNLALFSYDEKNADTTPFRLLKKVKAHERIIWGSAWSHDDKYVATASRDKKLKIWKLDAEQQDLSLHATIAFNTAVTSVEWAPSFGHPTNDYLLAVGLETGIIALCSGSLSASGDTQWQLLLSFPPSICHTATVRRLRWRGETTESSTARVSWQLASCGSDHAVRLFSIRVNV